MSQVFFFLIKALCYIAFDGSCLIIGGIFYRICIRETQLIEMCEVFSFHPWRRRVLPLFKSVACEWASSVEGLATYSDVTVTACTVSQWFPCEDADGHYHLLVTLGSRFLILSQ